MEDERKTKNELEELEELRKKVEAQDRELTIQNALERVRSKASAMQASDELSEVTSVLLEQFRGLGHELVTAAILVQDEASGIRECPYEIKRIERWFCHKVGEGTYGRLRDVTPGPDGHLYVLTSNTDGRAPLRSNDDKILRLKFSSEGRVPNAKRK